MRKHKAKKKKKRILVDLSATIIHHGHVRLLKKASKLGDVIVALTNDPEIIKNKGYKPEIQYKFRKEILSSIKYVKKVLPSNWLVDNKYLKDNKIDLLVHGHDNPHDIDVEKLKIFRRTKNISSNIIRKRAQISLKKLKNFVRKK